MSERNEFTAEELIAIYIQMVDEYADVTPANLAQPNPNRFVQNTTTDSALMEGALATGIVNA